MSLLELQSLRKSFGGFAAVDGVSMSVRKGGLYGLIGPNGAGKSTLFALASGLIAQDGGSVRFDGADVSRLKPVDRARRGLVRTFQVPREFKRLSVLENLLVAAPRLSGESLWRVFLQPGTVARDERVARDRAGEILEFLKLGHVRDVAAGSLSGGQKKLLELGRALMLDPKIVLLDEPFAGVNAVLIEDISARLRELKALGITVFVVEHNLPALCELVEELHVMDRGRLIASGEPERVLEIETVRSAYLGGAR
ncbi:MAG: ABC transporter ATP-binding protein [Proteobacteria bacterium]|nr:ABC transporter ATP-binding protein [Pseudomonadota bacterium]